MASIKLDQVDHISLSSVTRSFVPEPKISAMRLPVLTLSWTPLGKAQTSGEERGYGWVPHSQVEIIL